MGLIYLIRHGQASFLQKNYDQLTNLGQLQSRLLGTSLKARNTEMGMAFSGGLNRHTETANHFFSAFKNDLEVTQLNGWKEYDHMELINRHNSDLDDFEKLSKWVITQDEPLKAVQQLLNDSLKDWIQDVHNYDISWTNFKKGVSSSLHQVSEQLDKGSNAVVFTSGGPIAVILMQLLALQDSQFIELQRRLVNTSVTKLLVGPNGVSLSSFNEYSHLDHQKSLITYR